MRERAEQALKIVCAGLGLLLAVRLVTAAIRFNPMAGVAIPDLPSLPPETNAPAMNATRNAHIQEPNSNVANAVSTTNRASTLSGTNSALPKVQTPPSNGAPAMVAVKEVQSTTNSSGSNTSIAASTGTNLEKVLTNKSAKTNALAVGSPRGKKSSANLASMSGFAGRSAPGLAPAIQARVDRITDSEILGPVIHPMPMALLGIAGKVAFLRSQSGQTGLLKEGEELGELKLLKIGINRVLIERDGQKQELTIFSGYGGESLSPKLTESRDETTNRN